MTAHVGRGRRCLVACDASPRTASGRRCCWGESDRRVMAAMREDWGRCGSARARDPRAARIMMRWALVGLMGLMGLMGLDGPDAPRWAECAEMGRMRRDGPNAPRWARDRTATGTGGSRFASRDARTAGVTAAVDALVVLTPTVRCSCSASRFGVHPVHRVHSVHVPARRAKRAAIL
jgi:hypothetical protein